MKTAIASLLALHALGGLPQGTLAFTARPLGGAIRSANAGVVAAARPPTHLHGFFTKEKAPEAEVAESAEETAVPEATTEVALETTANGDASVPAEEEEEELSETQKLLQKVKQAGTAGGE